MRKMKALVDGVTVHFDDITVVTETGMAESLAEGVRLAKPLVERYGDRVYIDLETLQIRVTSERTPKLYVIFAEGAANPDGSQKRVWLQRPNVGARRLA